MNCLMPSTENGYSIKVILLCLRMSFRKWFMSLRIPMLFLFVISFGFWTSGGVASLANVMKEPVSPWLLPHYFANPLMMSLFGFLTTFLFSDAPFYDNQTALVLVRSGRKNWIGAKILYIMTASFVYAACWLIASLLPVLGKLQFTNEWGNVILSIANGQGSSLAAEHDIVLAFFVDGRICSEYGGLEATLLTFLLLWLVGAFLGLLIFCFNYFLGNNWGVIFSGLLSFFALFSTSFFVNFFLGSKLLYVSPVNWCSLYSISSVENADPPSLIYVLFILCTCIYGMMKMLLTQFRKRDILL